MLGPVEVDEAEAENMKQSNMVDKRIGEEPWIYKNTFPMI